MSVKGSFRPVLVQQPQLCSHPFEKVAVDHLDQIYLASTRGHWFFLSLVDICTHWVECVPLKFCTTEDIAEALFVIFSRMGFPCVILSDNGSQFISRTMRSFTDIPLLTLSVPFTIHPQMESSKNSTAAEADVSICYLRISKWLGQIFGCSFLIQQDSSQSYGVLQSWTDLWFTYSRSTFVVAEHVGKARHTPVPYVHLLIIRSQTKHL